MTKTAVGSDVDAYCTKCEMVLTHTIVALQGTRPRRVKCNTCGGDHNYRATKPTAKAAAKKSDKPKSPSKRVRQTWDEVMQEASTKPHKSYSMSGSFGEGDWIEHRTFGLGCVQSFTPPNKISVRFADSTRLLICNKDC
jgi:inhibitor of KinA sporulation pathway (predicted exonuclease)